MPAHPRWYHSHLVAIASLCVLAATPATGDGVTVRDAAGRSVTINDASRIVSVGGAVTEILYALGLEQRVVAVDTTSLYPPRAPAEKPNVGYMRQLSAEGVLGLGPSLVLATEGVGPEGNDHGAGRRGGPLRAGPRPLHRRGHRREDPLDRAGDRRGRARRMPGQAGRGRSRRARASCAHASHSRARRCSCSRS